MMVVSFKLCKLNTIHAYLSAFRQEEKYDQVILI